MADETSEVTPLADASRFRLHVLDMGQTKFGDCLVVEIGSKRFLIDGGHPGDQKTMSDGTPSIPDQLKSILKVQDFPLSFDLLVVTHAHADHIGCLPAMVKAGMLKFKHALVADPDLGYGKDPASDVGDAFDGLPSRAKQFALLLREEIDVRHMTDAELDRLAADAMDQKERYEQMLASLAADGCKVVKYRKPEDAEPIHKAFKSSGLRVLGPTKNHLEICRDEIKDSVSDLMTLASDRFVSDSSISFAEMYGALLSSDKEPSRSGNAVNSQSIMLSFQRGSDKILLAADMQLADPAIPRLRDEMIKLRSVLKENGPYRVVKLGHHTSHNAVDPELLEDWKDAEILIHTGGWDDKSHPARSTLKEIKEAAEANDFAFLRNDRNGRIGIDLISGTIKLQKKQTTDDFSFNEGFERDVPMPKRTLPQVPGQPAAAVTMIQQSDGDFVEVTARIPRLPTRVTISIEVEPLNGSGTLAATLGSERQATPRADRKVSVGGGRTLPPLVYVTSSSRLAARIGGPECQLIMDELKRAPGVLIDVGDEFDFRRIQDKCVTALRTTNAEGVVIVGGAEVIPPVKLNTVPAELEALITDLRKRDHDSFVVWSDEYVADLDQDGDAEYPVSRVPDGGSFDFLATVLSAGSAQLSRSRAGVRNSERPFADEVFATLSGQDPLRLSAPHEYSQFVGGDLSAKMLYVMLHGDDEDSTKFWGEDSLGGYPVALTIDNLDDHAGSVALAGCCWGALAFSPKAASATGPVVSKTADKSIALRFLERGGNAFIGCTGTHYSPVDQPFDYFGKPMHDAFWAAIQSGHAPARALHLAKESYALGIPHGLTSPFEQAIEHKILRQFTCLGLGW